MYLISQGRQKKNRKVMIAKPVTKKRKRIAQSLSTDVTLHSPGEILTLSALPEMLFG